jgi:hypothetical protein
MTFCSIKFCHCKVQYINSSTNFWFRKLIKRRYIASLYILNHHRQTVCHFIRLSSVFCAIVFANHGHAPANFAYIYTIYMIKRRLGYVRRPKHIISFCPVVFLICGIHNFFVMKCSYVLDKPACFIPNFSV